MSRVKPPPGTKGPHPIYLPFLRLPPALGQFLISASLVPPPSPAPTASCSPPSLSRSAAVPRHQRTRRPSSAAPLRRQSRGPPSPSAALSSAVPEHRPELRRPTAPSSLISAAPSPYPERRRRPSSPLAPVVHRRAACAVVVLDLRLARAPPQARHPDRGPLPPRPPNPKFCANFSELGVNFIYYILSRIQLLELGANFVQILLEFNFGYIIRIQL